MAVPLPPPTCAHELFLGGTAGPQRRSRLAPLSPEVVGEVGPREPFRPGVPAVEFAHYPNAAVCPVARTALSPRRGFGVEAECGHGGQSRAGRSCATLALWRAPIRPQLLVHRPHPRFAPIPVIGRRGGGEPCAPPPPRRSPPPWSGAWHLLGSWVFRPRGAGPRPGPRCLFRLPPARAPSGAARGRGWAHARTAPQWPGLWLSRTPAAHPPARRPLRAACEHCRSRRQPRCRCTIPELAPPVRHHLTMPRRAV